MQYSVPIAVAIEAEELNGCAAADLGAGRRHLTAILEGDRIEDALALRIRRNLRAAQRAGSPYEMRLHVNSACQDIEALIALDARNDRHATAFEALYERAYDAVRKLAGLLEPVIAAWRAARRGRGKAAVA
jgi:hypothetical protein